MEKLLRIQALINDIEMDFKDESLIKDNKLYFNIGVDNFRVRMPSVREYKIANQLRKQKELELLETSKQWKREEIKKILKEKQGVDLDVLANEQQKIKEEIQETFLSLAPLSSDETEEIQKYKDKLAELKLKFVKILTDITEYYAGSFESQIEDYYMEYLTYLCTERATDIDNDKWEKVWPTLLDFENSNSVVMNKSVEKMSHLLLHIIK